jgi:NADP-dependent 3-hydroxy acid dehydrogenase YdfG
MTAALTLVTGASSGLGRAVALEAARRGREVVLVARDGIRLEQARRAIEEAGGRGIVAAADVRDAAATRAALDAACGARAIDLLVHAAGVLELGPIDALDETALRAMLDVNVVGAAITIRSALPRLQSAHGHVVVVSSIAGRLALPGGFTGYGASKWAVRGWAEIARDELSARGIGLTVAYPSILDTPMVRDQHRDDAPAVYRRFAWHSADRAASRILDDAENGRRESFVTTGDRVAAWAAGAAPGLVRVALRALLRPHAGRR